MLDMFGSAFRPGKVRAVGFWAVLLCYNITSAPNSSNVSSPTIKLYTLTLGKHVHTVYILYVKGIDILIQTVHAY